MAVPKPMLTEFGIHYRLESCVLHLLSLKQSMNEIKSIDILGYFTKVRPSDLKVENCKGFGYSFSRTLLDLDANGNQDFAVGAPRYTH